MVAPLPKRTQRDTTVPIGLQRWLLTGEHNHWFWFARQDPPEEVWALHCNDVVTHYAKRFPGYRPRLWWRFSSPGVRRRVDPARIGSPLHECSSVVEHYEYGVPAAWRTSKQDGYLSTGVPLSREHPPMFESEANFLRRHDLLLPEERSRLLPYHYAPCVLLHRGDRFQVVRHDRAQR